MEQCLIAAIAALWSQPNSLCSIGPQPNSLSYSPFNCSPLSAQPRPITIIPYHRTSGGPKARLLLACGYRVDAWEVLEAHLRSQHLIRDFATVADNPYGRRYEIVAPLTTPNGRKTVFLSVWQIDTGIDIPRLITMYPR